MTTPPLKLHHFLRKTASMLYQVYWRTCHSSADFGCFTSVFFFAHFPGNPRKLEPSFYLKTSLLLYMLLYLIKCRVFNVIFWKCKCLKILICLNFQIFRHTVQYCTAFLPFLNAITFNKHYPFPIIISQSKSRKADTKSQRNIKNNNDDLIPLRNFWICCINSRNVCFPISSWDHHVVAYFPIE